MKYILSLDGGGIRGVFALELLLRMQELLREHTANPKLVLADHFDFFAGTSTGGIIATCLCWGMDVSEILDLYVRFGATMFTRVPWHHPVTRLLVSRYQAQPLSGMLRRIFSEQGDGETPVLLDTPLLRKLLLVVVRNHSTGSAWPLTNNPHAIYNDPAAAECNMKIPLWKILRASTAAPVYFDPEVIQLGSRTQVFVDGSITPYNNPAVIAALTATLPSYNLNWETGAKHLRVISLGTLRFSSALPAKVRRLWLGYNAAKIPAALIGGVAWEQDLFCRAIGQCLFGEPLDSEIGDLVGTRAPSTPWFSYVRYNRSYNQAQSEQALREHPGIAQLDAIDSIAQLRAIGREYALSHIRLEHLV